MRKQKSAFKKSHLKFHAVAIILVIGVVLLLYAALGPKNSGPAATQAQGDRSIQIDNATWGRNCDMYVDRALTEWKLPADASKAPPKPTRAHMNNVLSVVSDACNGKLTCTLTANTETLKTDPLDSCFKRLTVGYRCYSVDRLWTADISQGDQLAIDCSKDQAAATPTP